MPRKQKQAQASGRIILLVDDDPDYLAATQRLLEDEGHDVRVAGSGLAALELLRRQHVDLLLLDYFMPGLNGEAVVTELRQFDSLVQVILQTGYASEQPPREILRRLDIQGYFDKSEGPDKLLLWTDVGLKAAFMVQLLQKGRQGLRYILEITPDLHKIQPLDDLLHGLLLQISGLIGAVNSFLAVLPAQSGPGLPPDPAQPAGFVAMADDDSNLVIRAGIGRFTPGQDVESCLETETQLVLREALQAASVRVGASFTVVPLLVRHAILGAIYVDQPVTANPDAELLGIFANQAAVAIQNLQLYTIASLDPLTEVYVRRFLEAALVRELRSTYRSQKPMGVIMADLDGLKQINDSAGHLAGDQALVALGKALRQATRGSDIVGRYGGDEFVVVLPDTPAEGVDRVAQRILELLQGQTVPGPDGPLLVGCSLGLSLLEAPGAGAENMPRPIPAAYFQTMAQQVIDRADQALYRAKRGLPSEPAAVVSSGWAAPADPPVAQAGLDPAKASTFTSS